jgi:hypothetical protein
MFSPHQANAKVDPKTLIVVRRTLDEFGLMERRQFKTLAHQNSSCWLRWLLRNRSHQAVAAEGKAGLAEAGLPAGAGTEAASSRWPGRSSALPIH